MVKPLLLSGVLILVTFLPPAAARLDAQPVTTDLQIPLSGTVFYDLSDEPLPLAGWLHVNAQVTPKGVISVRVNADDVSGVGEITGIRYNVTGRDQATLPFATSTTADVDFRIIPADGFTLSCILRVTLGLTFDADTGELTDVSVEQLTVVH